MPPHPIPHFFQASDKHWGNWVNVVSANGLPPFRRQAIIWSKDEPLSIDPLEIKSLDQLSLQWHHMSFIESEITSNAVARSTAYSG